MRRFILHVVTVLLMLVCFVAGINYFVDASNVLDDELYSKMADLSLEGNIIAAPENYNGRSYQAAIINKMSVLPDTIVLGCSRGMFLGREITGFDNLYNNCVSGACLEDYYAVLGLYDMKFSKLPSRMIIEVSPWVFYKYSPENRWRDVKAYSSPAENFYDKINGTKLKTYTTSENPYFSVRYFQYNFRSFIKKGVEAFVRLQARISIDEAERAELPDGSIRYQAVMENPSAQRLEKVRSTKGPVTYQNVNDMKEIDGEKLQGYENMIRFLMDNGTEIIIYMQPFSVTQCRYIYDEKGNTVFNDVENYLRKFCAENNIRVVGGYDSRKFAISDTDFCDFMHLDKHGTKTVWNTKSTTL